MAEDTNPIPVSTAPDRNAILRGEADDDGSAMRELVAREVSESIMSRRHPLSGLILATLEVFDG